MSDRQIKENLHLVTVATHSERYLPILSQQAKDKEINFIKLGIGKKYVGHFMKDLEMIDYLNSDKVQEDDIVIFADGFDTLLLAPHTEIIRKFKSYNCRLLLSIENVGSLDFIHKAVFQQVKGKFINTGLFMGYAGFLKRFLEEMYSRDFDKKSNQKTWASFLESKKDYNDIALDIHSKVFLNYSFTTTNYIKVKDKRVHMKGIKPCFIQGNGCEDLSKIIKNTGYSDFDIHNKKRFLTVVQNNLKAVFFIYPIAAAYIFLAIVVFIFLTNFGYTYYRSKKDKYKYIYL